MTVFSPEWFDLHQEKILRFANTRYGRWILRIHKDLPLSKKIVYLGDSFYTTYEGTTEEGTVLKTDFRSHNKFAKRLYYAFKPLWWTLHAFDMLIANPLRPAWNLGFDTTGDLFPSAGAVSPCDGFASRNSVDETFATIRGGAGNAASATVGSTGSAATTDTRLTASATTDQFQTLDRNIYNYTTSSIGAASTITAGTISFMGTLKANNIGTADYHVCAATPSTTGDVITTDYGTFGSTSFGSVAYASFTTAGSYTDITLNASGLSAISKTAISTFGARTSWDINNSFTGTWASNSTTTFRSNIADNAGTSADPKLVVTFTVPPSVAKYMSVTIATISKVDSVAKAAIEKINTVVVA